MWKMLFYIFVIIVVFSGVLYLVFFTFLGNSIDTVNSDFLPFIPLEIRIIAIMLLLGLAVKLVKSFIE